MNPFQLKKKLPDEIKGQRFMIIVDCIENKPRDLKSNFFSNTKIMQL